MAKRKPAEQGPGKRGVKKKSASKVSLMSEVVHSLTTCFVEELTQLPEHLKAVYVGWSEAYEPDMTKIICVSSFGFENLCDGNFNPAIKEHVWQLGDFVWEGDACHGFLATKYPGLDWTEALKRAGKSREVQRLCQSRQIQFVVGEDDGDVFLVSK